MEKEDVNIVISDKNNYYKELNIPKKNGTRTIYSIKENSGLYEAQKNLKDNFLDKIPVADHVYGFIKGSSYKDFLSSHVYNNSRINMKYMRLDIKDFFGSIDKEKVSNNISYYIRIDDDEIEGEKSVLKIINELVTMENTLPQGAITSPVLSNIIFRQLDIRIQKYCRKLDINYSRYADDLLFSSTNNYLFKENFLKKISYILRDKRFRLNFSKTIKSENEISMNGFVVGDNIRLSRKRKYDISKVIFLHDNQPVSDFIDILNEEEFLYRSKKPDFKTDENEKKYFLNQDDLINYLAGYRSFLIDWIPVKDGKAKKKHLKLINKVEKLLKSISDIDNDY